MTWTIILSLLSAVAAFVAAGCWFWAGYRKVSPDEAKAKREAIREKAVGGMAYASWTTMDGSDMEFTLAVQSQWNCYGATAAGIAALLQGASTIISIYWPTWAI